MDTTAITNWLELHLVVSWQRQAFILGGALLLILLLRVIVFPILRRLTTGTGSNLDDEILDQLRPTVFLTVFLVALQAVLADLIVDERYDDWMRAAITTWLVVAWGRTALRIGGLLFERFSRNADRMKWIEPRTLPLIQFTYKVVIFATMSWSVLAVWHINLTGWLASAGVMGIAVGFAAKDTLANFISGIFILVDAPYSVGEYIVIDGVTRGEVTDIGMRSTRILTRDNVEVTVPNAVIGNAKIINESSGPSPLMRVRVNCSVAYGSDVEEVKRILLGCCSDIPHVTAQKDPSVRFVLMGPSSLDFQVRVYVEQPAFRGRVIDLLNTRIYQALTEAGVKIPFPQQDLYIKEWPDGVPARPMPAPHGEA